MRDIYATLAKFEVVVKDTEMNKLSRLDDSFDEYSVTLYDAEKMLDKCKTGMRKELETQMESYNVQMTEIRTASQTELPFSNEKPHKEALEIIEAYKGKEMEIMLTLWLLILPLTPSQTHTSTNPPFHTFPSCHSQNCQGQRTRSIFGHRFTDFQHSFQ